MVPTISVSSRSVPIRFSFSSSTTHQLGPVLVHHVWRGYAFRPHSGTVPSLQLTSGVFYFDLVAELCQKSVNRGP
ncbi:hypothetical protein EG68_02907 [Paragonimus skrjabini miyazakii]|uniref:Uncharacterized protein n=1 Tax=Paragonimus skrjabini miyazakii TaxID=59628 RepID=A0A8S9YYZ9_9TREM|nr:hypothetical protein EG68_02907 [Paragonimus skrjabini miyazakii]